MRNDCSGAPGSRQNNLVRGRMVGEVEMSAAVALRFVVKSRRQQHPRRP